MGGIIFFRTKDLKITSSFYENKLNFELWLDQKTCKIFKYNNLLLGFCENEVPEIEGMITLFFNSKNEVNQIHSDLFSNCPPPIENSKYNIYQFFAKDPEGRTLEFQSFLHPISWPL